MLDFGLISLKSARNLIRQKKFSSSLSNCFFLYFFGVGSFFRYSISLTLRLSSCLVLEVLLDGYFLRLCGRLFGLNVFSLLRSVWDSFSVCVANFLSGTNIGVSVVTTLHNTCICTLYNTCYANTALCLVGCGVSFVVEFCLYFK